MHIQGNTHLAHTAPPQQVTNEASTVGQGLRAVGQGLQSVGQAVGNGGMAALQATGNVAKNTLLALLSPIAGNTPGGVGGAPLAGMLPWIARSVQRNNEHPSAIDLREQTVARTWRGCLATTIHQGVIVTITDTLGRVPAEYVKRAAESGDYQTVISTQVALGLYHGCTLALGLVRNLNLSEEKKLAAVAAHFGKSPEEITAFCQVYRHRDKRSVTQTRVRQHLMETENGYLHHPRRGEVDPARTLKILNNMRMRDTAIYMAVPLAQDLVALTMTLESRDRKKVGHPPNALIDGLGAAMTKSAVRNAIYAPLREAAQHLWGVKTGDANLNHTEALECGIRYIVNQGYVGHLQDTGLRAMTGLNTLFNGNAWTLKSPDVKTDFQRVQVLTVMSAINAVGEVVNGIDDNLMRAQRAQRQAVIDLRLQHRRAGRADPIELEENAAMRPHTFGGDSLSGSFTTARINPETFKRIAGRLIGSAQMRAGLLSTGASAGFAIANLLNKSNDKFFAQRNSHTRSLTESCLVSLVVAGSLYVKFNANAQSLGTIRNNVDAEPLVPHPQIEPLVPHPQIEELPDLEIGPLDGDRPRYPVHAEIAEIELQENAVRVLQENAVRVQQENAVRVQQGNRGPRDEDLNRVPPGYVDVRAVVAEIFEEAEQKNVAAGDKGKGKEEGQPARQKNVAVRDKGKGKMKVADAEIVGVAKEFSGNVKSLDYLPVVDPVAPSASHQRQSGIQENAELSRTSSEGSESSILKDKFGSEVGDPDVHSTRTNYSINIKETADAFFKRR